MIVDHYQNREHLIVAGLALPMIDDSLVSFYDLGHLALIVVLKEAGLRFIVLVKLLPHVVDHRNPGTIRVNRRAEDICIAKAAPIHLENQVRY